MRPTRQRVALAHLLFSVGDRHICAEDLHAEATGAQIDVSLATVYNTLNQLKSAGLVREIAIEGERSYFDTNTADHYHFFDVDKGGLMDIDARNVKLTGLPALPEGKSVDRIDVIIRLRDR